MTYVLVRNNMLLKKCEKEGRLEKTEYNYRQNLA